jgi:hypothetical protein
MVINYLHRNFIYADDIGIGFAYFNFSVSMSVSDLLGSLLQQLVMRKAILSPKIRHVYRTHMKSGTRPTVDTLSALLQSESQACSAVFIVLDALDEFREVSQHSLLRVVENLGSALRLLITARPSIQSISKMFPDATRMEIRAIDEDIQNYVLRRLEEKHVVLEPRLLNLVQKSIAERSEGT